MAEILVRGSSPCLLCRVNLSAPTSTRMLRALCETQVESGGAA